MLPDVSHLSWKHFSRSRRRVGAEIRDPSYDTIRVMFSLWSEISEIYNWFRSRGRQIYIHRDWSLVAFPLSPGTINRGLAGMIVHTWVASCLGCVIVWLHMYLQDADAEHCGYLYGSSELGLLFFIYRHFYMWITSNCCDLIDMKILSEIDIHTVVNPEALLPHRAEYQIKLNWRNIIYHSLAMTYHVMRNLKAFKT